MANAHRRRNSILRIKIDGNWLSKERMLKDGIVGAFQKLLTENGDCSLVVRVCISNL